MELNYIERLIRCGFTETTAKEICDYYINENQWDALDNYVRVAESVLKGETK